MLNTLIISLHFPPDNIIAARRSEAYARHFHKFGIFPTIVTDRFEKIFDEHGNWIGIKNHDKGEQPIVEEYDSHSVIRLPRYINPLQGFQKLVEGVPILSQLFTLAMHILGHFDMHLLGHYSNYKKFLFQHLKTKTYNMVLAIDGPHFHSRLASELNKKFKISYVCDFRDLYDNYELNKSYSKGFTRTVNNFFKKKYFKYWLRNAEFVTSVSSPIASFIGHTANKPWHEITNGFEDEQFTNEYKSESKVFTIGHFGTLYPQQNIANIALGVKSFIEKCNPAGFKLRFVGLKKNNSAQVAYIKNLVPINFIEFSGRIDREDAISQMKNTQILFYPAWSNAIGIYSGKLFEYLGARKPILFAPGDNGGVVDQLLAQTRAGITANTPEEVCNFITEKYNEWKENGDVAYYGIEEEIKKYSREEQVKKMAGLINSALK